MTTEEFSNTFDTLLNSYNTQANFGEAASKREIVLDEYEKSVLLTQAQDIIVKTYFDRTLNNQAQGFDDTTRRQIDFSSLTTVKTLTEYNGANKVPYDSRGIIYGIPNDVLVVLNEKLEFKSKTGGKLVGIATIVPINYKEYDRSMSKAYNQPLKRQAWRLFQTDVQATQPMVNAEIIPIDNAYNKDTMDITYKMRYIRRPRPIVLVDFSKDTTDWVDIDRVSTRTECELNPIVHMDILNKAVELAIVSRGGSTQTTAQQQQ